MSDVPALLRALDAFVNATDFYGARERLEADDRLVRERAAAFLDEAAAALRDAEGAVRRMLPPPTRAAPDPPAEALARLRRLHGLAEALREQAALWRAAPLPHRDRLWEAIRSGSLQVALLLEQDLAFLRQAAAVRQAALRLAAAPDDEGAEAELRSGLSAVAEAWRRRADERGAGLGG